MSQVMPPQNIEAEEATLGSLLIDPKYITAVAKVLNPADFFVVKNGWIYQAILALGENADLLTVSTELAAKNLLDDAGGESYLAQLTTSVPTALNVEAYARVVEETSVRRRLLKYAGDIAKLAYDQSKSLPDIEDTAKNLLDATRRQSRRSRSRKASDVFAERVAQYEELANNPDALRVTPTGYIDLDKRLGGGMYPQELTIVAARPGMGKTAFAGGIVRHNAIGRRAVVAQYTFEMSNGQMADRYISAKTGISSQELRQAKIESEAQWHAVQSAAAEYASAHLYMNDEPMTVAEMREDLEFLKIRHGRLDLVVADFLDLFLDDGDTDYQRVSRIARGCKVVASALDVPVLLLAQLSRACETRDNKRPQLSDLRDSGKVEEAMNTGIFIYREGYYNKAAGDQVNIAEIITAKQRNGPTGTDRLFWNRKRTCFENLVREEIQI